MSFKVEKLEKNMAKITIEVSLEKLEKAVNEAFLKNKNRISLPGFRKGKATRQMIERIYGKGVFLEDAANSLLPTEYGAAAEESGLEIVSQPKIEVEQLEAGKDFIFTAEVAVKPEVTLGEYKGLEVPKTEIIVSDEEVESALKREQEKNARTVEVTDRAAQMDDTVTLDFEGSVDGVAFDGGKGTDHKLVLGSGSFIPGFEDQLVGANSGDHVEVNVTFPAEYHEKSLAGKEAVFQCDIKKIEAKEMPELDDEFAQDVSEFNTLDEYKNSLREGLVKNKEEAALEAKENAAVQKAIENASMEIPDPMVETRAAQILENFARRMQAQGLSMEQYFQFTGLSRDAILEQSKEQALREIQTRLVLEEIAKAEGIEASEEEIEKEISDQAAAYNMDPDKIRENISEDGMEQLKMDIAVQKAIKVLADTAVEVETTEEKTEE